MSAARTEFNLNRAEVVDRNFVRFIESWLSLDLEAADAAPERLGSRQRHAQLLSRGHSS